MLLTIFALSACANVDHAQADVLLLKTGGRVEGELLNPEQEPRTEYRLELKSGGTLTLVADQVVRVVSSSPQEERYLELLKKMPTSAAGNFKMSEICERLGLKEQRTFHLQEVVMLDPKHEKARRALGHVQLEGEWGEQGALMKKRGYVKFKGRWRLPEDIELIQQREKAELKTKQWNREIKLWRSWIGKRRGDDALDNFAKIEDPLAADGVIGLLQRERDQQLQATLIEILGRLQTADGLKALVELSLKSEREETRQLCLDQLVKHGREMAMHSYLAQLKSPDNRIVRRAGMALQRVADKEAIEPLIDALVTTHKFKIQQGGPGQLNATQGTTSDGSPGVSGFGVGGGPKITQQQFKNREVLDALVQVVGGINFHYDQTAWKRWLVNQSTPAAVDLRRG